MLDTTIANVSVPTIAGNLGVSSTQGTWVITSYAVAEAITVPLTGWLAKKFGAQRTFITCYLGFAVVSLLCGMSSSLGMLLGTRVLLGLVGGPDHAAVADAAAAHLPEGEGDARDRHLGDDHAGRAGRRPDPRRHHLRQLRLAVDLLHQGADRRLPADWC